MTAFLDFVLERLPRPPARVLEVGCGAEGGVTLELAAAGYDVLGIDPQAPQGPQFLRTTIEQLDDRGPFAAVVASRVLHHVTPLGAGIEKLARLAPLLLVDEFAPERIDQPTRAWYEAQHRRLADPLGPADLGEWAERHPDLHPSHVVLGELERRYEALFLAWRPYLSRWLGVASDELEQAAIEANTIRAVGFRYAGLVRK
ncbi:MAG TPA: class I SAM-dependent methyltransferase [Gaiellaceae bacterium]